VGIAQLVAHAADESILCARVAIQLFSDYFGRTCLTLAENVDHLLLVQDTGPGAMAKVKKVFVGGISPETTEEHMEEYFSRYGRVESVSVITDKDTGKSRGFGFVTYSDFDPVDKICGKIHSICIFAIIEVKCSL